MGIFDKFLSRKPDKKRSFQEIMDEFDELCGDFSYYNKPQGMVEWLRKKSMMLIEASKLAKTPEQELVVIVNMNTVKEDAKKHGITL